jgi:hypothetical protein
VRLTAALVVALALLTALPAGAAAKLSRDAQKVYDDYRSDAAIQPCDHTVAVYRRTLREITPAIEEETPAFRPAVEAALRERDGGRRRCLEQDSPTQPGSNGGGSAGGSAGGSTPPAASPAPAAPSGAPPASAPPAGAKGAPAPGNTAPAPQGTATPAPTVAPAPPVTSSAPPAPAEVVLLDRPHEGTPLGVLIALGLLALSALLVALALLVRQLGWGEERLAGARHAWGEATYRASATWADFVDWIGLGRGPHRL